MDEKSEYLEKMAAEVTPLLKLMKLEEGMQLPQLKETAKAQLENLDKILVKHAAEMKRLGINTKDLVKKLIQEDPLGIEPSNCNKVVYENCVILKTQYEITNILESKEKLSEPRELITFCRDVLLESYRKDVKTSLSLCEGDSERRINVINRGHQNAWLIAPDDDIITVTKLSLFLTGDDFKDAHSSYMKALKESKKGNVALCQALPYAGKDKIALIISSKDLFAGIVYDLAENLDISDQPIKDGVFNDPNELERYLKELSEKPAKSPSSDAYSKLFSIN